MMRFWISLLLLLATGMSATYRRVEPQDPNPLPIAAAPLEDAGSCGTCHAGIEDMHPWHPLTCSQCHGGNDRATTKTGAHVAPQTGAPNDERVLPQSFDPAWVRFVNPSDLRVATRTCGACHADATARTLKSLHATTAGHLSDGLYENGVTKTKESPFGIFAVRDDDVTSEHGMTSLKAIPGFKKGDDPALLSTHFQDLARKSCMRCHLWSEGTAVRGRLGQDGDYRGSGCATCHVTYADDGLSRSGDPTVDRFEPGHPVKHTMVTNPPTDTCTRCHYGDASIGLHFRGLAQLVPGMPAGPDVPNTTDTPLNGTFYVRDPDVTPPDIHHERGMHCVDCHTGRDLMGDGEIYGAMEDAIEIECIDCHGTFQRESQLRTSRGAPLRHLRREGDRVILKSRVTGVDHEVPQVAHVVDPKHPRYNATAAKAMNGFHNQLECYACHTSWNVNFFGFHFDRNEGFTQLDLISGKRTEGRVTTQEKVFSTFKEFRLGWNSEGKIAPYMVGFSSMGSVHGADGELAMRQEMPETAAGLSGMTMIHHQVHSVRPAARSCVECHRSPTTWGLGSPNFQLGRDLVLVTQGDALQVLLLDPKNPTTALPLATLPIPNPTEVVVDESAVEGHVERAYVISAPTYDKNTGIRMRNGGVLEISFDDPLRPSVTNFVEAHDPREIALAGTYLILADGEGGVKIFDRKRDFARIAEVPTLRANGLAVSWPHVFVADGPGGVLALDLQNPKKPAVVSAMHFNRQDQIPDDVRKVAVMFQYSRPRPAERSRTEPRRLLAVAGGRDGLILLDATEPTRPRQLYPEPALRGAAASRRTTEIAVDVVLGSHFDLGDAQGQIPTVENDYAYVLSHARDSQRGNVN
ncbi:MAG: hypothetical protein H6834_18615, partial [Planctomycetes bacterium]|nr:hypothetical protein [Planctomycetota bacterium]